jgi:hypothetical protein
MPTDTVEILKYMFEDWLGFLCLGRIKRPGKKWEQEFFLYPDILDDVDQWIQKYRDYDLYFCPHLLKEPNRKKEEACPSRVVWADLDECSPDKLGKCGEPLPSIVIQTSQTHYQAYWKLNTVYSPEDIENINHRVYETYRPEGCDACWALTHMMRLPNTVNHKRDKPFAMNTVASFGECTIKDFHRRLPFLKANKHPVPNVNMDSKPYCKFDPRQLRMFERHIWFDHVSPGKRSERVFELVRLAANQLKCNDAGVVKLLMEHPTLMDKFPDEEHRKSDIMRCLTKLKEN